MVYDQDDLLISRAMEEEKMISFRFKGRKIRACEPHVLIKHKETDIIYLLGYQTGGFSETCNVGWKIFTKYNIFDVVITELDFKIKNVKIPTWAEEIVFLKKN